MSEQVPGDPCFVCGVGREVDEDGLCTICDAPRKAVLNSGMRLNLLRWLREKAYAVYEYLCYLEAIHR